MSSRKKRTSHLLSRSARSRPSPDPFYNPFMDLPQRLEQASVQMEQKLETDRQGKPAASDDVASRSDSSPDDDELFRIAVEDVTPLNQSGSQRLPVERPGKASPRFLLIEELEACAQLVDLVSGTARFELCYSDEYVEGAVAGLSPEVLSKLRRGEFSYQDYVDLHGYNSSQARDAVTDFVQQSYARGYRCILIVPGRGLNSRERQPILKENLVSWLTHSPLKRLVLAFSSARSHDGGVGAFYVLLRRGQGKSPFISPAT